MRDGEEVRVTSETGGQKGSKLAQFAALDPLAIVELAKVAGFGAEKYSQHNFLKGYDWSLSANAAQRHFLAWLGGEDLDPESGLPHLAHAMWNLHTLVAFQKRGLGTDDRPSAANLAKLIEPKTPEPDPSDEIRFFVTHDDYMNGVPTIQEAPEFHAAATSDEIRAAGFVEIRNDLGPWRKVEIGPKVGDMLTTEQLAELPVGARVASIGSPLYWRRLPNEWRLHSSGRTARADAVQRLRGPRELLYLPEGI